MHKVLVVEDHDSFRQALCGFLQQRADVLIVGESTDGLDAVHQAEALQPDVVLLDIGLPTLNGLQVANRMRATVPNAKVLLVTNESSLDVVEEAFRRGAHGYVYKPRLHEDLFLVFDAILEGGQRVSRSLERIANGDVAASHRHDLLFCSSDVIFENAFSHFIAGELRKGKAVIVLVTESHDRNIRRLLYASNVDFDLAIRQERYLPVNIDAVLSQVSVNGWPDEALFAHAAGDLLRSAASRATGQHPKVAACGECAPTLWAQDHVDAALQLEHLWDELSSGQHLDTLCAYPISARHHDARVIRQLCRKHTAVEVR
jgi:DNA-binding NarL/FixJ family response regulator